MIQPTAVVVAIPIPPVATQATGIRSEDSLTIAKEGRVRDLDGIARLHVGALRAWLADPHACPSGRKLNGYRVR